MITHKLFFLLLILTPICFLLANDDESRDSLPAPKVYIDCDECDYDFIRTEIAFVNYVIDRKEADIHIMVTDQRNASGGREQTLTFIGQAKFLAKNDTISHTINKNDTYDVGRKKMVKYLKMGLMSYVLRTPIAANLNVEYNGNDNAVTKEDDWDNWVYRMRMGGRFRGEESTKNIRLDGRVSADRITEEWKIRMDIDVDYNEESYKIDGETVKGISRRNDFDANFVKSLTEHWSTGLLTELASSTYSNKDVSLTAQAGIEYNIFPYSESTRRDFRIYYGLGYAFIDYKQTTIYNKLKETLLTEKLGVKLEYKQPWGRIDVSAEGSHYFHDLSKNRLNLHGAVSLQLLKGFSLYFWGGFSRIHDQLALPKGDATGEEILLEIRELETQYSSWISVGFEYTFGSIYNNIVNPRF